MTLAIYTYEGSVWIETDCLSGKCVKVVKSGVHEGGDFPRCVCTLGQELLIYLPIDVIN